MSELQWQGMLWKPLLEVPEEVLLSALDHPELKKPFRYTYQGLRDRYILEGAGKAYTMVPTLLTTGEPRGIVGLTAYPPTSTHTWQSTTHLHPDLWHTAAMRAARGMIWAIKDLLELSQIVVSVHAANKTSLAQADDFWPDADFYKTYERWRRRHAYVAHIKALPPNCPTLSSVQKYQVGQMLAITKSPSA